jgi:ATP-dependent Clp protease protease subunit
MNYQPPSALIPLPHVYEQTHRGERALDVWSRLLLDRIIFLGTEVTAQVANAIIAQFLFLEAEDPEKPIHLYINSPGGDVSAGLAIYDTMHFIKAPVGTLCAGRAASMGAFLLAAGEPGLRQSLPHSEIMIHQPWTGGVGGQVSDIQIRAKKLQQTKDLLNEILAKHTGKDLATVATDTDRDFFMTAAEAVEYGIIDRIVTKHEDDED